MTSLQVTTDQLMYWASFAAMTNYQKLGSLKQPRYYLRKIKGLKWVSRTVCFLGTPWRESIFLFFSKVQTCPHSLANVLISLSSTSVVPSPSVLNILKHLTNSLLVILHLTQLTSSSQHGYCYFTWLIAGVNKGYHILVVRWFQMRLDIKYFIHQIISNSILNSIEFTRGMIAKHFL